MFEDTHIPNDMIFLDEDDFICALGGKSYTITK